MKYHNLATFKIHLTPTSIRFHPSPSSWARIPYHTTTIHREQEPSTTQAIQSEVLNGKKQEWKLTNQEVRASLNQLPSRPKRLDHTGRDRKSSEEIFLNSLDQDRRIHRRVGSTYSKARSPVYFPNVDIRLVRPSSTDRGDPFTAIFRCDLRLTKPDIFNYLRQIYGIGITSIRTAIYRNKNRRRLRSKVRGGVVIDNKRGERTFKKVWIGLDKPFFFPNKPNRNFLSQNYNFNDLINTFQRYKLIESKKSKLNQNQILPAGLEEKGLRTNVFRNLLDNKLEIHQKFQSRFKKSLNSFTPSQSTFDHQDSNLTIDTKTKKLKT